MEEPFIGDAEQDALREVVASKELWRGTSGNFAARFEDAFGKHVGRRFVHAVSAGTAANETALAGCGIGPGDEVICPPCSFIASSLSAVALGAVPVFADVDPRTLLITAEAIGKAVTPRARAVVVVHLWGQSADMGPILEVARRNGLMVVEDCAQAYDVYYKGKKVGTLGDAACYSLQQSKHITSGEGGIVTTDDAEIYKRAVLYANCGMPWYRYDLQPPRSEPVGCVETRGHFGFGHNYRISELQAAVAFAQLAKIDVFNERRRELVQVLEEEMADAPGISLAHVYPDTQSNFWAYPIWLDTARLRTGPAEFHRLCVQRHGVGPGPYHEVNYLEAVYQEMNRARRTSVGYPLPDYVRYDPGACPQAEAAAKRLCMVGTHHGLAVEDMRRRGRAIRDTAASLA
jgi:dTDP-4-amino-4,6-dideoxygalactose transaminase